MTWRKGKKLETKSKGIDERVGKRKAWRSKKVIEATGELSRFHPVCADA